MSALEADLDPLMTPRHAHDAWSTLAGPFVTAAGVALLTVLTCVGLLGSPPGRALLDAPDPHAPVSVTADERIVTDGLAPGWWPSFDRSPFFEPLAAVHLEQPPRVVAGGRTVLGHGSSSAVVRVEKRYAPPGGGPALQPRDVAVGDHVDVTYTVRSLTPETLRDLVIIDPVLGRVPVEQALPPRGTVQAVQEDVVVPPRVASGDLPKLLLGTDPGGRDLAARLAAGTWRLLGVAGGSAALSLVLGGGAGWLAARSGRQIVSVLGRAQLVLVTFPFLLLALVVVLLAGAAAATLVLLTAAVSVPVTGRRVRDAAVAVRRSAAVEGAIASGRAPREILRGLVGPAVARTALATALQVGVVAALVETSLGFLGLVPRPPTVSLGAVIADVRPVVDTSPGYLLLPGLLILAATLGGVLASEGIARAVRVPPGGDRVRL